MSFAKVLGALVIAVFVGSIAIFGLIQLNTELPIVGNSFDWDDPDPDLQGKVVHFDSQMYYILLDDKHVEYLGNGQVKVGRALRTDEVAQFLKQNYFNDLDVEEIKSGMRFTITKTAWRRENIFQKMFTGDYRYAVLEDENGIESTMSVIGLMDSNKPELAKFDKKGEYRNYALLKYFTGN